MAQKMVVSEFMIQLTNDLENDRGVAASTAHAYVKTLYALNGKKPFKSLSFLKDTEAIGKQLDGYAETTKKTILAAIVSVLSLVKDKPAYKKVYAAYHDQMMVKATEANKADTSQMTEKQKENWMTWEDWQKVRKELKEKVAAFAGGKTVTADQYQTLLDHTVLSLYTDIAPRRNQDYLQMWVARKAADAKDTDKNYLVMDGRTPKEFVFNVYKTQKTYGQQRVAIPDTAEQPLAEQLRTYLKFHPMVKANRGKLPQTFQLLVNAAGEPLNAVNSITRILNRIFGRRIGSSMLRHIFLSSKYDVDDMKETAKGMGHSVSEQKKYLKSQLKVGDEIALKIDELESLSGDSAA